LIILFLEFSLPLFTFHFSFSLSAAVVPIKQTLATMKNTTNFASAWQQNGVLHRYASSQPDQQKSESGPSTPTASTASSNDEDVPSLELSPTLPSVVSKRKRAGPARLNKFVRRLHDMLQSEQESGVVEWRKGLLVLHSTDTFTKKVLPKYFNTKNFKTFRRQLNYYGFVHVRSFSTTGSTTTALWVNQDLAKRGSSSISSVLMLKRVEPCESAKTAEGRRLRKEEATHTVADIGVSTHDLQIEHIRQLAAKTAVSSDDESHSEMLTTNTSRIPAFVHCEQDVDNDTTSSTQIFPQSPKNEKPILEMSSTYPTTDDAANLLIMFSKSAQVPTRSVSLPLLHS